jgi:predicted nuclease with TOPRIM domain
MADELAMQKLADNITSTEEELEEVKDVIKTIRTGERSQARTHLQRLETEKEQLRALLLQYEIRLNAQQQQQQSGAGTSMLPVRQEAACQMSCCIHLQSL